MPKLSGPVYEGHPVTFGFERLIASASHHQFEVMVEHRFRAGQFLIAKPAIDCFSVTDFRLDDYALVNTACGSVPAETFLADRKYVVDRLVGARSLIKLSVFNSANSSMIFRASLSGYYMLPVDLRSNETNPPQV